MKRLIMLSVLLFAGFSAIAKLPPLSDEAKAKADEARAKTAHGNKVADHKLCLSQDKVAAQYARDMKAKGKSVTLAQTPPCADPGAFVWPPAPAPVAAAAPAAAPTAKK
ncbi:MAG: hypothetical protein ACRCV9_04380 [Burkholderiaceae bacterium]